MATRRASARARPAKRYTNDAFDGLDFDDDAGSDLFVRDDDSGEDDEFDADAVEEEPDAEDDLSVAESSDGPASGEDDDPGAMILGDDEEPVAVDLAACKGKGKGKSKGKPGHLQREEASAFKTGSFAVFDAKTHQQAAEVRLSSRGVPEMYHNTGKDTRILNLFGPAKEDVIPAITARDKWHDEPILPTRKVDSHGEGGMGHSPLYTDAIREHEASRGWEWYYENDGEAVFSSRSQTKSLSKEKATDYLPQPLEHDRQVLLGPHTNQRIYSVKAGEVINLGEAWGKGAHEATNTDGTAANGPPIRQAWLFNLGAKIQCLDWVPWREGTQYLALATLQRPGFPKPTEHSSAPGFVPTPSTPASIQVWTFLPSNLPGQKGRLDFSKPPKLDLVLCTDWGTARQIKWCPMPKRKTEEGDEIHLGLLAGVWGDGKIRVLDVRYPKSSSTQYIHVKTVAFESNPPDTVCTSVAWLSSQHVGAGCANGSVAVWALSHSVFSPSPRPFFYHDAHSSYILSIASAYPSHPFLLATSSMDGYLRLIDLRAPHQDTLLSQRSRTGSAPLAWHEVSQSFLTCDENYTLLALSIRRFHVNMSVGRANSNIVHLAASPVHPFTLMGCSDGMVISTNPMRKVMIAKAEMWHQTWFAHEWRRPMDQNGVIGEGSASASSRSDLKKPPEKVAASIPTKPLRHPGPLSRVLDGFKAEVYKLWVEQGLPNQYEGVVYNTIHEEETAITQVAWNPNIRHGGWAAAGMGDGLIRVEDLAL